MKAETNKPRMLLPDEAAEVFGLAACHIRRILKSGELKHVKVGRKYLISERVLMEYLHGNNTD